MAGVGMRLRGGLWLTAAWLALCAPQPAPAQASLADAPQATRPARPRILPDRLPDKPSQAPAFKIPVAPLGFSPPSSFYMGQRTSLVSLDFLGEDRLLFTFRAPGLIRRDAGDEDERQIRALLLKLPNGAVEAEALWTLHDRARYLWMLNDGHFLLRNGRDLEVGDASLELKPYLRFPGPVLWLETDPTQTLLITDSREPAAKRAGEGSNLAAQHTSDQGLSLGGQSARAGDGDLTLRSGGASSTGEDNDSAGPGTPANAETAKAQEEQNGGDLPDLAVRILRRDSGEVILVSRTRTPVHLAVNADGYLEGLRGRDNGWLVNLDYFSGGSSILGQVDSTCSPLFDFLSEREVLATGCTDSGAVNLVAVRTDGRRLWEAQASNTTIWPRLVKAPDGARLAWESLVTATPVSPRDPLNADEVKGQLVEILDAADGNIALETTASPALDAGGNVAISPSGRRVAVLNNGQIYVYELAPAPQLQTPAAAARRR